VAPETPVLQRGVCPGTRSFVIPAGKNGRKKKKNVLGKGRRNLRLACGYNGGFQRNFVRSNQKSHGEGAGSSTLFIPLFGRGVVMLPGFP